MIYYDGVLPKNWPPLEELSWKNLPAEDISKPLKYSEKSQFMKKSFLPDLITILDYNVRVLGKKI